MFKVNKNPTRRDVNWFSAGMVVVAVLLAVWLLWQRSRNEDFTWSAWDMAAATLSLVALVAGAASLISAEAGRRLYVGWMTATLPIGIFLSTVLLTAMYFVVLPVFSLIVRLQDPLRKKPGGSSFWTDYPAEEPSLERMRRPF